MARIGYCINRFSVVLTMISAVFRTLISVAPVWAYRFLLIVSQIALIPFLISHLGVVQYGIFVVLIVFGNFTSVLDFGLGSSFQVRYAECAGKKPEERRLGDLSAGGLLIAAILGAIVAAILGPSAFSFFHIKATGFWGISGDTASRIVSSVAALSFIFGAYAKILIGKNLISRSFIIQGLVLAASIGSLFVGILVWNIASGEELFFLRTLVMAFVNGFALIWILREARVSWRTIGDSFVVFRLGVKFMLFNLICVSISGLPYKFINSFLGNQEVVVYNILDKIFGVIFQFGQSPLVQLTPKFTMGIMQGDSLVIRSSRREYFRFALFLLIVAVMVLFLLNGFIFRELGGGKLNTIGWVPIFSFSILTLINLWVSFYSTALQAGGRLLVLIASAPIQVGVLMGGASFFVSKFGIIGAIAAVIISNLLLPCWILPWELKRVLNSAK